MNNLSNCSPWGYFWCTVLVTYTVESLNIMGAQFSGISWLSLFLEFQTTTKFTIYTLVSVHKKHIPEITFHWNCKIFHEKFSLPILKWFHNRTKSMKLHPFKTVISSQSTIIDLQKFKLIHSMYFWNQGINLQFVCIYTCRYRFLCWT